MYSKAFKRPPRISDETDADGNQDDQTPVVVADLSALNKKLEAEYSKIGKNLKNPVKTPIKTIEASSLTVQVFRTFDEAEKLWLRFEKDAACFIYQQFSFCRTWYETVGKQRGTNLHIVVVQDADDETLMLVPLCLIKNHFGTTVSFIGNGMADYLAPLVRNDFAASLEDSSFDGLWEKILGTIEVKIDMVWLDRQPVNIIGISNPISQLAHFNDANSAHALNFPQATDWAECARMVRSNKTVKKIERRLRQLAKQGPVELIEITDAGKRQQHMNELLALKISNLNDAGTLHRMDTPEMAAFYHDLVDTPSMQKNLCHFELRCDGHLVASVLGLVHHKTFYYQICAFNRQEFSQYSPGLLLLYQLFDWCFARGLKRFDMTIGDEGYKSDWSNETTQMVTVAIAYSNLGRLSYVINRTLLEVKTTIKSSPLLRKLTLRLLGN